MLAAGPAPSSDDAPPAVIGTSTTLAHVHALYDRAHPQRTGRPSLITEEWRLLQDAQTGTFRVRRFGRDRLETTTLGPLTYLNGIHGATHWQQNRNGITFTFAGIHETQGGTATDRAWPPGPDARLIGESVTYNAYVVESRERRQWLFVDKRAGTVVRLEKFERGRRYATTYDDFHTFDGTPEPSHVKTLDSYGNEREQTLLTRTFETVASDPHDFDVPPSRRMLVEFPSPATRVPLPVRLVNGLVVVKLVLDGRAYDFLLDTGAAGIVIDPSVVEHLGLERYGSRVGGTLGTFPESTTIVPAIGIGSLRMRYIVARVVPVPFRVDDRTRVAGLLGFDFLADVVLHVDLDKNLVEAIPPGAWRAPSDAQGINLLLDDKTPVVRTRIGASNARVILDTGANRTVLEQRYSERADLAGERGTTSSYRTMGGRGYAEALHLRTFELAGVNLGETTVEVSPADVGGDDVDGVVGTDVLRGYELWFDYRTQQAYVRRAKRTAAGGAALKN